MLTLTTLASGSSGNCYILQAADGSGTRLLLEAGIRFEQIIQGLQHRVRNIAACLVTHCHGDHAKAVERLSKIRIPCYASIQTWDALNIKTGGFVRSCDPLHIYTAAEWSIQPFDAVHDAPGALGYVISGHGAKALFLTDTAFSRYKVDGLTHCYIEANYSEHLLRANSMSGEVHPVRRHRTYVSHMSIERVEEFLKVNDLRFLQEIQLLHLSDTNSDPVDFVQRVRRLTGVPTKVAQP